MSGITPDMPITHTQPGAGTIAIGSIMRIIAPFFTGNIVDILPDADLIMHVLNAKRIGAAGMVLQEVGVVIGVMIVDTMIAGIRTYYLTI